MARAFAPLQVGPTTLTQPILPGWSFSLFNVDLGPSSDPETERRALETAGGYGRQIGHIAEALEVVIEHLDLLDAKLPKAKRDALKVLLGDVAAVRTMKAARGGRAA